MFKLLAEGFGTSSSRLWAARFPPIFSMYPRARRFTPFAQEIEGQLGGADIVINNAGVAQVASVEELAYDDFEWVMNIDFWGMVYGSKAFLPQLRKKGGGHIVNVSSIFRPLLRAHLAALHSAGSLSHCKALRHECAAQALRVLRPTGGIKTNILRNARFLQSVRA